MFSQNARPCRVLIGALLAAIPCFARSAAAEDHAVRPANRLASESSPYLRMHSRNPVDWYPWGPEALDRARRENKPIFLSIGYSSCYWCHVMERKVFENEEIAAYMNEHFINIKVDREERPDLDDLYMLALQVYLQATGSRQGGGWPLSIFLTPEGKPIAGGTYFPPEDLDGRPGFPSVLRQVHGLWTAKEVKIREAGDILAKEVQRLSGPQQLRAATEVPDGLAELAIQELTRTFDPEFGGFDFRAAAPQGPKFPQPCKLLFLEWAVSRDPQSPLAAMLDLTLTKMAEGGLYDHLGGGFHRYSTDREWRIPHFEKMLYDNAQLAEVYAAAARRTGRSDFRKVALGVLEFVRRDFAGPQGGFYSALDAETDGVEGAYYAWTDADLHAALNPQDAELFCAAYGCDRPSSFEQGHVLSRTCSTTELAGKFKSTEAQAESRLAEIRGTLFEVRLRRPALMRDEKIITAWNGLMIRSLARCGEWLDQPDDIAAAEQAALFILTHLRTPEGQLKRSFCQDQATQSACLDDYANLIEGLLALHQATGDARWLNASRRLMDDQTEAFWDQEQGGYFFTSDQQEPLLARLKDGYDSVTPSGNGTSASNLLQLASRTRQSAYRDRARELLLVFATPMQQSPSGYVRLVQAAAEFESGRPGPPSGGDSGLAAVPPERVAPGTPEKGEEERLQPAAQATPEEARKHEQASGTAYLSADRLVPGGSCRVAVVIDIAEKWHLNANPAKPDYVVPVELELKSAAGIELTDVVYPQGTELMLESFDDPVSAYEGQIVIYGTLKAPAGLTARQDELQFNIRYQACSEQECLIPKRLKLNGTVPLAGPGEAARAINTRLFQKKKPVEGRSS